MSNRARPSAFEVVEEGETRSIVGRDLALVFSRPEGMLDRWTHTIEAARTPGGPREPIARAVEWDTHLEDPSNISGPVFQEMQFQFDDGDRPVALFLGMSGRRHFSASFLMEATEDGITLSIDVADRCRDRLVTSSVASNYRVLLPRGNIVVCEETEIAWDLGSRRLILAAGPSTHVEVPEAGGHWAWVGAWPDWSGDVPSTLRWQYSWSLSRPST